MADLTGRELCDAIAVDVMGWEPGDFGGNAAWFVGDECKAIKEYWYPDTNYGQVATVRAEIERRGLQSEFILELNRVIQMNWNQLLMDVEWTILNATPEQQCRAALKAVEGAHA